MPQRALVVTFVGDAKSLEAAFKRVGTGMSGMQAAGQRLNSMGGSLTRNLTVPILGLGAASAVSAVKFQQSMELLHTQAGASQQQVNRLSREVLNMAGPTATAPQALAEGMYHVVSSLNSTIAPSRRVNTELRVMRVAAEGAKVGNANLVDVTNALDAAIVSGVKGVSNYSQAMGALNAVVGAGDMTMQDLADALGTGLLGPMKTFGLSLTDVGGALAVFGDNNIRGEDAATKLISAVRIMAAPSKAAAKELKGVGLSTLQLADDMRTGGLVKALGDLKAHLVDSGLSAEQQGLVISRAFGGRQSTGVQVLLGQLDRLRAKTEEVGAGAHHFGQAWTDTTHTAAFKVQRELDTMKADLTRFGSDVLPIALQAGHTIATDVDKVAHAFASLPKPAQNAIVTGGLVMAALGPAMKVLGAGTTLVTRAYTLARFTAGLATGTRTLGKANAAAAGASAAGARGISTVARMEVGTLIAKTALSTTGAAGAHEPSFPSSSSRPAERIPAPPGPAVTGAAVVTRDASLLSRAGSVAAQGIGIAGLAALATPVALAFGEAIKHWISRDAYAEGKAFAERFTAPLPAAVRRHFTAPLAVGAGNLQNAHTSAAINAPAAASPLPQSAAERKGAAEAARAIQKDAFNTGWLAGKATVAGLKSVRDPSATILIQDFMGRLSTMPAKARPEAAKVMLEWAEGLAQNHKLPARQIDGMIASLEQSIPGLGRYLLQQGLRSDRDLAIALKFNQSTRQLTSTLQDYRAKFGDLAISTKITGANIDANIGTALRHLHTIARTSVGQTRKDALAEIELLNQGVRRRFDLMVGKVQSSSQAMRRSIAHGSAAAAADASGNFNKLAKNIADAMGAGELSTREGAKLITEGLNATLKAFGQKPISLVGLTAGQLKSVSTLSGVQEYLGGAGTSGLHKGGVATGGIIQFGRAGERGPDNIPVSFAGKNIVVGSGEMGLVLTGDQQAFLNARTADVGGIPGVFQNITRLHYMAKGGIPASSSTSARAANVRWPELAAPAVKGAGTVPEIVRAAVRIETAGANAYGRGRVEHHAAKAFASGGTVTPPSQSVSNQILAAQLSNRLVAAENAGDVVAQQKILNLQRALQKRFLAADNAELGRLERALRAHGLTRAHRGQLNQDVLSALQEIGNVRGNIGSVNSSLAGLGGGGTGGSGSFDLAPTGASVTLPTAYDVRESIRDSGRRLPGAHRRHRSPWGSGEAQRDTPVHHSELHVPVRVSVDVNHTGAVEEVGARVYKEVTTALRARMRTAGMRGT